MSHYYLVTRVSPGTVNPVGVIKSTSQVADHSDQDPFIIELDDYLRHCQHIKPFRAHHCRRCRMCILKMDHHCDWIGRCVGLYNQAIFIKFLSFTALSCLLNLVLMVNRVIEVGLIDLPPFTLFIVLLNSFIFIPLLMILFILCFEQWRNVVRDKTCIEVKQEESSPVIMMPLDSSVWDRMKQVFGHRPLLWMLPIVQRPDTALTNL